MKQYLELCQRIIDEGVWIENERTGKRCLTVIDADLTYDVGSNEFPLITTRKSYWKSAIAEILGWLIGNLVDWSSHWSSSLCRWHVVLLLYLNESK